MTAQHNLDESVGDGTVASVDGGLDSQGRRRSWFRRASPLPVGVNKRFLNGSTGSDGNDGLSPETAWATFTPFRDLCQLQKHFGIGCFLQVVLTDSSRHDYAWAPMQDVEVGRGAGIDVYGTGFNVLKSATAVTAYTPPADVAAFGTIACSGGLGANALRGKTLRMKTGNAAGMLCTIAYHTDTAVYLARDYTWLMWTIAPGDTFEVVEPVAGVDMSGASSVAVCNVRGATGGKFGAGGAFTGLLLANVWMRCAVDPYVVILNSNLMLFGVEFDSAGMHDQDSAPSINLLLHESRLTCDPIFTAALSGYIGYFASRSPFGAKGTPTTVIEGFEEFGAQSSIGGWGVSGEPFLDSMGSVAYVQGVWRAIAAAAHNDVEGGKVVMFGGAVTGNVTAKGPSSEVQIVGNYSKTRLEGYTSAFNSALDAQRRARISYGGCDFVAAHSASTVYGMVASTGASIDEMASTFGSNSGSVDGGVGAKALLGGVCRFQAGAHPFITGTQGDLAVGTQTPVAATTLARDHGIVDPDGTGATIYHGG